MTVRVEDGRLLVEIADAQGELHDYAVRPLSPPSREPLPRSWELVRLDTGEAHSVYLVVGHWACTCKAFVYGRSSPRKCKHTKTVSEMLDPLVRIVLGWTQRSELRHERHDSSGNLL